MVYCAIKNLNHHLPKRINQFIFGIKIVNDCKTNTKTKSGPAEPTFSATVSTKEC